MKMNENNTNITCGWAGSYNIQAYEGDVLLKEIEIKNVVTYAATNALVNHMFGSASPLSISHFVMGTGTLAPTRSDISLEVETFRKEFETKTIDGTTEQTLKTTYVVLPGESTDIITEIGIFANGTATPDSGILVSRVTEGINIDLSSGNVRLIVTRTDAIIPA